MRALDLFCCAGGASMGLHRAGYDVVGIDIRPQKNYPFPFIQADALRPPVRLEDFDFVWASPPCQKHTTMQGLNVRGRKRNHPCHIDAIRRLLRASGRPYVIENVPGAPLWAPFLLCGSHFGLGVKRHRHFESNLLIMTKPCGCRLRGEPRPIAVYGDHPQTPQDTTYRCNRARTLADGGRAMGIDWMDWRALTQAVPPAYAEYIGRAARTAEATRCPD